MERQCKEGLKCWQNMFAIPRSRYMELLYHILYGDLTITETRDILRSVKDLKALYKGLIFRGSSVLKKSK